MKNQSLSSAVTHSLRGVRHALRNERNFRMQAWAGAAAGLALFYLQPGALWIAIVVLAAGAVLGAELNNTAVERLADHLHPQQHEAIRIVKDCAAAAVLMCSLAALGVAVCLVADVLGV
jgi:undecaprenol kinase